MRLGSPQDELTASNVARALTCTRYLDWPWRGLRHAGVVCAHISIVAVQQARFGTCSILANDQSWTCGLAFGRPGARMGHTEHTGLRVRFECKEK